MQPAGTDAEQPANIPLPMHTSPVSAQLMDDQTPPMHWFNMSLSQKFSSGVQASKMFENKNKETKEIAENFNMPSNNTTFLQTFDVATKGARVIKLIQAQKQRTKI